MKAIPFRGVAFVFRQAFFRPATRRTRRTGRVQPRRSGDALRNHTKRNSQVYKIMEEKKLYNAVQKFITLADGREIMIETGKLAKQADGSVVVK